MYVERLELNWIRTFVKNELQFIHPDMRFRSPITNGASNGLSHKDELLPRPRLRNVNLLLGNNGSGKTTILQAIALAALGPAEAEARLPLRKFVRFVTRDEAKSHNGLSGGNFCASFRLHSQDGQPDGDTVRSRVGFIRKGDVERVSHSSEPPSDDLWSPVYSTQNDAFFCAAYGATRRVESGDSLEPGQVPKVEFLRGQRLQGIFQDSFALFPLPYWLPRLQSENPVRYKEVVGLLNRMLGPGHCEFIGEMRERDYLFDRGGTLVPFRSLSDGYRGLISWVADLLYHVWYGSPSGRKLTDSAGVVLVDEIDLHLHPKWQMQVVGAVARAFPRMQFIFTSHSPLVAGSLEWMNIITLKTGARTNRTIARRLKQSIHGLDADQILLTDFFGLSSTMAPAKRKQLQRINERIRAGDRDAPLELIRELSSGTEADE